jgi:lipopolysaccharide transport system permease protein
VQLLPALAETWAYRRFVTGSVLHELRSRYSGSLLGVAWAVLQPFSLILIYTVVFSSVMGPRMPGYDGRFAYSIYLCAGLLLWTFFSDLLSRCLGIFVGNGNLLKKVSFPRLTLPIIALLSALLNYAIIMALFLALLALLGKLPGAALLGAVPVIALTALLAAGLGLTGATINVYYRDVEQFTGIALQFWFWLTPIVYAALILPPAVVPFFELNPVFPLVAAMQGIFLEGKMPAWGSLAYPAFCALLAMALALLVYYRLGGEMVDEL